MFPKQRSFKEKKPELSSISVWGNIPPRIWPSLGKCALYFGRPLYTVIWILQARITTIGVFLPHRHRAYNWLRWHVHVNISGMAPRYRHTNNFKWIHGYSVVKMTPLSHDCLCQQHSCVLKRFQLVSLKRRWVIALSNCQICNCFPKLFQGAN